MRAARSSDGWRLAVGTLTALPIAPPARVGRGTARAAVLLAPAAAVPLGLAVAGVLWVGYWLELDPLVRGLLAVSALALGTRAFHLDGLADTADGLTSSHERERSLAVMKSGTVGPAGAAALIVVLGLQAVGFAALAGHPLAAGVLVCLSRAALALTCLSIVPSADGEGLRTPFAGCMPLPLGLLWWAAAVIAGVATFGALDLDGSRVVLGSVAATVVVGWLIRRAVTRLGGVTGDVFGAGIEITLASLLIFAAGAGVPGS